MGKSKLMEKLHLNLEGLKYALDDNVIYYFYVDVIESIIQDEQEQFKLIIQDQKNQIQDLKSR